MKNQFRQTLEQQKCARCRWWEKSENYCHLIQRFTYSERTCEKWEMARKKRDLVMMEKAKKTEKTEETEETNEGQD